MWLTMTLSAALGTPCRLRITTWFGEQHTFKWACLKQSSDSLTYFPTLKIRLFYNIHTNLDWLHWKNKDNFQPFPSVSELRGTSDYPDTVYTASLVDIWISRRSQTCAIRTKSYVTVAYVSENNSTQQVHETDEGTIKVDRQLGWPRGLIF